MNSILTWDTELFLWLNNLGGEFWDAFWLQVSEMLTWIPLYGALLFLVFRALDTRLALISVFMIVLNVLLTDQGSTWIFKEQFQRLRPCHVAELQTQMRMVKEGCGGLYGFLSAHAANTFGMAMLLGTILKKRYSWLRSILFLWAAFVAYSRIYLGVHYPLDIICGAIYGIVCGYLIWKLYQFITKSQTLESD